MVFWDLRQHLQVIRFSSSRRDNCSIKCFFFFFFIELQNVTAYDKNGLRVDFSFDRPVDNPNLVIVTLTASSSYGSTVSDFLFQAAVPKTFQLQMMPASSTVINSGSPVTQVMRILNPSRVRYLVDTKANQVPN